MAETHELLEHSENGNYYPHGKFISKEEAHKHAKSLGLNSNEYTVHSKYGTTDKIRKEAASIKEHEHPYWDKK